MNSVLAFCLGLWLGAAVSFVIILVLIEDEERTHRHDQQ